MSFGEPDDLKSIAIRITFGMLPLEKRRKLAVELLRDADIVHGMLLDPMTTEFEAWLCSGEKKLFTKEETQHAWSLWSHVKKYAVNCNVVWNDEDGMRYYLSPYSPGCEEKPGDMFVSNSEELAPELKAPTDLQKEDFLTWLLKHSRPEQIGINCATHFEIVTWFDSSEHGSIKELEENGWKDPVRNTE